MDAQIIFYDWRHSPFCMKVRAILDFKGLAYQRINPLGATMIRTSQRGKTGKVPAVKIDGQLIADSTDIAHALERLWPNPTILPDDPRDLGLCHALEDWADESIYFIGLYFRWFDREGRAEIPAAFGPSPMGMLAYRFYLHRILAQLKGQGTSRKSFSHVASDLERHLDAIEKLIGSHPFLIGDRPFLCDFALWGQLTYLQRTPTGGRALDRRPTVTDYIERVRQPHRRVPPAES
jgi:glutathione S-transferase